MSSKYIKKGGGWVSVGYPIKKHNGKLWIESQSRNLFEN